MSEGHSYHRPRRIGERKHKSVHEYIVDVILNVPDLVIIKIIVKDIPGQLLCVLVVGVQKS